ncbi:DUF448 domain-containing protein [Sphingomonas sp.]|uniref:DUF448 domain-containing protein n=1 Tax=Sphingomonas sp. TaxID=28214 RepID=UPI001DA106D4|nr:DUF448 domain-containing protein [Sphingomonas sp.]MBX9796638.1 DUF448 domain-containing protein [Sphingomonas sp.]
MRTPNNETREVTTDAAEPADDPIRRCILSGERAPCQALVRLALAPDGQVLPDVRAKAPGRGAWIGVPRAALETAIAKGKLKGALARAFKTQAFAIPADLPALIAEQLERAVRDRLGLAAKAGMLLAGGDRIEQAAREGRLKLLLHAADAGADGTRRLAQAWRVGRGEEGSGLAGLVLPLSRATLSVALGRENVVHVGITDPGAARRLRDALDRWQHFIGPDLALAPCETVSQGASRFAGETPDGAMAGSKPAAEGF